MSPISRSTRWQRIQNWLKLKDPVLVTTVNDQLYIHLHKRLTFVVAIFILAAIWALGMGMMSVIVQVSPAMFRANQSLDSCMRFEEKVRKSYAGRVEYAAEEVEVLKSVNAQLITMLQKVPNTPLNPKPKQIPAPTMNVGGDP